MPESINNDVEMPEATTAAAPGFGTWTTASANRPAWLELECTVETDGTTDGLVIIDVDESGGTVADYSFTVRTPSALGGVATEHYRKLFVPAGASYQVRNSQDPALGNALGTVRQVTG